MFVVNARNSLAISSDSESELSITQSSFRGGTAIELLENNFESLFACADNEQAVDNLNFRSEDLLTDLTTTTDKEIQARNKARDATKHKGVNYMEYTSLGLVKSGTPYQQMTASLSWYAPNSGILKTLLNFELSLWLWKLSVELPTKEMRVCCANETAQFDFRNFSVVI